MTRSTQVTLFWLGTLVAFLVAIYVLRDIMLPFVAGLALAYVLDPVAGWMERRGFNRTAAAAGILGLAVVLIVVVLLLVGPLLVGQLLQLVEQLPQSIDQLQMLLSSFLDSRWAHYVGLDSESLRSSVAGFLSGGSDFAATVLPPLLSGGLALVNVVSLFIITPFVAFFMLRDWDKMIALVDSYLPRDYASDIRSIAREMNMKVAAFVRGQMLSALILGLVYATGLLIIGLNYGLLIGLASGVLSFIPFVGYLFGIIISLGVALAQFWPDWIWIVAVIVVFQTGQALEAYVLQPRLLGSMVGLHPVWLLFGLFSFGLLFGFVGLLIAIPAAAAVGVLLRFALERYRKSSFFRGSGGGKGQP